MSLRRLAGLLAFVATSFLAFPQLMWGQHFDFGVVFAWLAPACFVVALDGLSWRRAAGVGFLAGWLAQSSILYWIYIVTAVYGHAAPIVGVLAPIGLALQVGVLSGVQGAVWGWLCGRGRGGPFVFAALWAVIDHLRHVWLTGFSWGVLGYAQHENPWLLGLAPFTGVMGLSFVTALGGAAVAGLVPGLLAPRAHAQRAYAGFAASAVGVALALGALSAGSAPGPSTDSVRVGLVQGNIDQGVKWSRDFAEQTMVTYEALSRRAVAEGARVVVWPETAVPGSVETEPGFGSRLAALAQELGVVLVVGAVGVEPAADGSYRFFDSAYLYDGSGARLDRYDKAHLVPFGEYLPMRRVAGRFLRAVATGIARDDVTPGESARAMVLPLDPDHGGPPAGADAIQRGEAERIVRVGVPICYELLFPDLVRQFAADGGEMLIGITNDAWYGRTGAPYQFLAITALRAAETRLWTARTANTGITALIDDRGRVRAQTDIFEETILVGDVPLRGASDSPTFYVRHGEIFSGACWIAVAIALGLAHIRPLRE